MSDSQNTLGFFLAILSWIVVLVLGVIFLKRHWRWVFRLFAWIATVFILWFVFAIAFPAPFGKTYNLLTSGAIIVFPLASIIPVTQYIRRHGHLWWRSLLLAIAGLFTVLGVFTATFVICWFASPMVFQDKIMAYTVAHQKYFALPDTKLLQVYIREVDGKNILWPKDHSAKMVGIIERGMFSSGTLENGVLTYDANSQQKINLWWVLTDSFIIDLSVQK